MNDRRVDDDTRDRIDEIQEHFRITLRKVYYWVAAGVLLWVFTVPFTFILINDNRGRADRIQKSRAENIYNNCIDANIRNEKTKKVLHHVILQQVEAGKITANGGKASEKFTILLINALAPHRNCLKLTLNQTQTTPEDKRTMQALATD